MKSKLRAHLIASGIMASGTACMVAFSLWPNVMGRAALIVLAALLLAAIYGAIYVAVGELGNDRDR